MRTTQPLEGVRVLDLTRWLAGPTTATLLGDLGADVIKVEPLPEGDHTRLNAPFLGGEALYFLSVNRNKKSVALDFRHPKAREVLRRLVHSCDVLVENFKRGVTDQLGLSYETLSQEHPRLIYGAITSYGLTGPYKDRGGLDQIVQGMGGFTSVTGFTKNEPVRAGVPISDLATGMFGALAIVAALYDRAMTGQGRQVEVSLLESTIGLMCFQAQKALASTEIPEPQGNNHPLLTPCGTYPTKNGLMNICVSSDKHWQRFCSLLNAEELLNDQRFKDNTNRQQNRDELNSLIATHLKNRTKEEWTDLFSADGIPAGPLYNLVEMFNDPHVVARGIVEHTWHAKLGQLPLVRSPIRMEGMETSVRLAPPVLGEHTQEVLSNSGFSQDEIRQLTDDGVVLQANLSNTTEADGRL